MMTGTMLDAVGKWMVWLEGHGADGKVQCSTRRKEQRDGL
jgi:hypothetical protein